MTAGEAALYVVVGTVAAVGVLAVAAGTFVALMKFEAWSMRRNRQQTTR